MSVARLCLRKEQQFEIFEAALPSDVRKVFDVPGAGASALRGYAPDRGTALRKEAVLRWGEATTAHLKA
jgi:hypothetical protein